MASTWRHPKSKFWSACFTDRDGRRLKRSTKTTNRKVAQKLAEQYETAARNRRTARQAREVIASLHKELTGEEVKDSSLRAYVVEWLERKAPETAPATLAFYKKSTKKFTDFLGADADKRIDEITARDIERFRNANSKVVSATTSNHDLKGLRMLFKAAKRSRLISEDPTEEIECVKSRGEEAGGREPFTLPQLRLLLGVADDEWTSMVFFGLYTSQRLGDLARLLRSNLDLVRGELRLVTGKTGRLVILPLAEPLRRHLLSVKLPDVPTAPLHARAFGIMQRTGKSGGLSNLFSALLEKAGLRERKDHHAPAKGRGASRGKRGLSFHSLRHTTNSLLHDSGLPAAVIREFVGHESASVNARYTHVGKEALERAAAALPDFTKE